MHHNPRDPFGLFLGFVQDLSSVSRLLYVPGAVLLLAYPVLAVLLGTGQESQAFVTAFMLGLALRLALGFEALVQHMQARYAPRSAAMLSLAFVGLPLIILAFAADPLSCQRLQSAFHLVVGTVFLSDVMHSRTTTAASFWPDRSMRPHLQKLSRLMVLFNFGCLALNEMLIQWIAASHWLLCWAIWAVMAEVVLQTLVQNTIRPEGRGQPI